MQDWNGVERRERWGRDHHSAECPVDPECFFRTKQQVEINTARLDKLENIRIAIIEKQISDFIAARNIAEGVVKGTKGTLWAAGVLLVTSLAIVISLFVAVINGKISIGEFLKIVF